VNITAVLCGTISGAIVGAVISLFLYFIPIYKKHKKNKKDMLQIRKARRQQNEKQCNDRP